MAKGPQGQTRPADVIGCAIAVARIATGEADDIAACPSGKVRSGIAGAQARARSVTKERSSQIAKKAAEARWRA